MFEKRTDSAPPSLNALRAFEAMARTRSATAAGEELRVTHSAVSRQVKALEASLKVRLFEGPKHRLRLTAEGQALGPRLTEAFDVIAAAVRQARGVEERLVIAVNASLSVKWLIPRLARFTAVAPEVQFDLIELAPTAYSCRDAHAILRILSDERCRAPGVDALLPNHVGPVCSPELSRRCDGDWRTAPKLTSRTHPHAWAEWAVQANEPAPTPDQRGFAHLHFAADAAKAGLGVVVLPWAIVADDVAAGVLVPMGPFVAMPNRLAVAYGSQEPTRALRRFITWLRSEAERLPRPPLR